jgi:hypothetical protein
MFNRKNEQVPNNATTENDFLFPESGSTLGVKKYRKGGVEYELEFIADGKGGYGKSFRNSNLNSIGEEMEFRQKNSDLDNPNYEITEEKRAA